MWISKAAHDQLEYLRSRLISDQADISYRTGEQHRLEIENARLRADLDWFKHRLNQVERERGQLIQAAIGVKIAVPEFVPTYEDPGAALGDMPDLSSVGNDAKDDDIPRDADPGDGVNYTLMPGYTGKK